MLFLVVDDDALSRELLTLLLEAEGDEVEVAVSGEAAVSRIASYASQGGAMPSVILTDIQMPGLAGGLLATQLRSAMGEQTLLLAMSGSQPPASSVRGFDGFILKPFSIGELKSMIHAPTAEAAVPMAERNIPARRLAKVDGHDVEALDEDIYGKMCDLMPAAQLGQMYTLCVEDARKRILHMRVHALAGNDALYRSEAHAVKGGCGMIGAKELYTLGATAEENGLSTYDPNSGTTSVTATLNQLELACGRLERILQERTRE